MNYTVFVDNGGIGILRRLGFVMDEINPGNYKSRQTELAMEDAQALSQILLGKCFFAIHSQDGSFAYVCNSSAGRLPDDDMSVDDGTTVPPKIDIYVADPESVERVHRMVGRGELLFDDSDPDLTVFGVLDVSIKDKEELRELRDRLDRTCPYNMRDSKTGEFLK